MEQINHYGKFKAFLAENNIKHSEVADLIGVTNSTFSKKINRNNADFNANELRIICNHYKIKSDIFFKG